MTWGSTCTNSMPTSTPGCNTNRCRPRPGTRRRRPSSRATRPRRRRSTRRATSTAPRWPMSSACPSCRCRTATTQSPQMLTSWAKGVQSACRAGAHSWPSALHGHGSGPAGCAGAGQRGGPALLGRGIRHGGGACAGGGLRHTDVEFGLDPAWHPLQHDAVAPPASGLLPGIGGLQIGVVLKLDGDPLNAQRIQISLPGHAGADTGRLGPADPGLCVERLWCLLPAARSATRSSWAS